MKRLLPIIIIIAFALRIYSLGSQPLWLDEAITVFEAQQGIIASTHHWLLLLDPPLVHQLLLSIWIKAFGISEVSVRLMSAIIGTASVYTVYLIGKRLFHERAGIFAAIIVCVSPFHIYYSQEARHYILLFLLVNLSFFHYLNKNWKSYIAASALAFYTHFFALFAILAQNAYHFLNRKKISEWIKVQGWLLVFMLPWFLLYTRIHLIDRNYFANLYSWIPRAEIFCQYENCLSHTLMIIFGGLGLAYFFLAVLLIGRKHQQMIIWFLSLLVPFVISFIYPIFQAKYVIFALTPAVVLAGHIISRIRPVYIQSAIMLVIVAVSLSGLDSSLYPPKEDWRTAAEYLSEAGNIVVEPDYYSVPLIYYINRHCFATIGRESLDMCLQMGNSPANRIIVSKIPFEPEKYPDSVMYSLKGLYLAEINAS